MGGRTHLLFKTLGSAERVAVLRAVLREGEIKQPRLRERLAVSQSSLSRYLSELAAEGLVVRTGNAQAPFRVPRPAETLTLLRSAGMIHAAHHGEGASDGIALASEMEKIAREAGERENSDSD
jgi:DNA-binding HxlR family transcriptional regulator